MKKLLFSLLFFTALAASSQNIKVYPSNWWVGMKNPTLQLLIHSQADITDSIAINYPGVIANKISLLENKHYATIDITITPDAKPGILQIQFIKKKKINNRVPFELFAKNSDNGKTRVRGVRSEDLVYLIMPDRFSNGDTTNDIIKSMRDGVCDRGNMYARHGGDLKGIENHLDYFTELGVTSLWLTPVIENDMPLTDEGGTKRSTYHGYAFTDHYNIDKRFGGNKAYKELVDAMHSKGLKIIQDAVYNHVGASHWFAIDPPMHDWFNQWPTYTQTSYKDQPMLDPYASAIDKKLSNKGWFTGFMPDLNQENPVVSNFLIQHAIWCTELYGIDGWRVDTYFYSNPEFLNRINNALLTEFPSLTVFGEAWVQTVTNSAYFCENNIDVPFKHNLQGVTDFPLYFAMLDGVNQSFGWAEGVNKLYATLVQDILYKDPYRNAIFLDNHDLDRIYSVVGEDDNKFKMVIAWLLTLRGIPQLYYGTEILMKNFKNPSDAKVREDFPGGWKTDAVNKFTAAGRNEKENDIFNYIKKLAHYRKSSSALTTGKLMQFVPADGVYVYFRYDDKQTVAVISNTNKQAASIDATRFEERLAGFESARNIITGEEIHSMLFSVPANTTWVLELQ
ncbi:MAG: glycoside hydrolase family 13 protein [Agriterribacter sp.]|nr:MAG: alpha-amylase [Sphingobacteriales bacterium 40-81]